MRRRPGFTLIEILVAMALTIFLMVILAQCFVAAMTTFRQLKAVGDMEAGLRTAGSILRRDLAADHFEGKRRLSDPQSWVQGPPREGFFRIYQGTPPRTSELTYHDEGPDADTIHSFTANDHVLHFTVKLRGNQRPNFFSTTIGDANSPLLNLGQPDSRFQLNSPAPARTPPYVYSSQWAEVAYFLYPTGQVANGTPLYALYRRQRLAVANNNGVNWTNPGGPGLGVVGAALQNYPQVSCWYNGGSVNRTYFNSPIDLTVPGRRFASSNPKFYVPLGTGDDLLLTNVVSFEVKVLLGGPPNALGFVDLYGFNDTTPINPPMPNTLVASYFTNNPQFSAPLGPRVIDTWSSIQDDTDGTNYTSWKSSGTNTSIPQLVPGGTAVNAISVNAISATLRVWDSKTEQTRQITILQDM